MKHKTLQDLLKDSELHRLVKSHLGGTNANKEPDFAEHYTNLAKKLDIERFIVPIFGVQGSGKSTLLNALLFKHPVLPVEADETTCVPVEIMWSEKPRGTAQIIFQDKREESIPADEEHLATFIDNASNPGNKRGVSRVILESNCELLQNGLVLVDLPGIGSLTKANIETTQNYLKESVGIIFMLRTTPPITQSDSIAIQLQWPSLPYAFFIQNRWNDESKRQATEGLEHNLRVLREIAAKARVPLEPDGPKIHMVNAYKAWLSALNDDFSLAQDSGLDAATDGLRKGICEWPQRLTGTIREAVRLDLQTIDDIIQSQLADLTKNREQLEAEMTEEKQRFDSYIRKTGESIDQERGKAVTFKKDMHAAVEEYRMSIRKSLRNVMRTKMKAGIVDGQRLITALGDEQKIAFDDAVEKIHERLSIFVDEMKHRFATVESWEGHATFRESTFQTDESTKYEDFLPKLLGAGGTIGGYFAGTAILAFLVSNPAGWAIAAGLAGSAIIGLFGHWVGSKGREVVLDQRIAKVEPQVFDAIDKFVTDLSSKMERCIVECLDGILSALDTWKSQQELAFLREKRQRMETYKASDEEKQVLAGVFKNDLNQVTWYQSQLTSL